MDPALVLRLEVRRGAFSLHVDIEVEAVTVAVIGPNGAGKSTLLRTLLGEFALDGGRIQLGNAVLEDVAQRYRKPVEERRLAYLPQGHGLFPHLTVVQNLRFALACGAPRASAAAQRERLDEAIERFALGSLLQRYPRALSGGERQRAALARALSLDPRALLLDEPLAALDPVSRAVTRRDLGAMLGAVGLPTLLVTHDPRDVWALAERVLVLEAGRVAQLGTPKELATSPKTAFIEAFFGEAPSAGHVSDACP